MQALLDLIKQSPLWQEAEAEGEAEGRLAAQRDICLKLVSRHHPEFTEQARSRILACVDPAELEAWILAASEPEGDLLARLLSRAN